MSRKSTHPHTAVIMADEVPEPPRMYWDRGVTIALLALSAVIAIALVVVALFLVYAYDTCADTECNYDGFVFGWLLALLAPPLILIISGTAAIVRLVRRRRAFWIPLVGIGVAGAVWWIGAQIVFAAVPNASF